MTGAGPDFPTGSLLVAWRGDPRISPQPASSHRARVRPGAPRVMLLLMLLLPLCWAVEVKRPRGVSLTRESCGSGPGVGVRDRREEPGVDICGRLPQFLPSVQLVVVLGRRGGAHFFFVPRSSLL